MSPLLPYRDALTRSSESASCEESYAIAIPLHGASDGRPHLLTFDARSRSVLSELFRVVDGNVRGSLTRREVRTFVSLRCPVFLRRDAALRASGTFSGASSFDEAWASVTRSGLRPEVLRHDGLEDDGRVEFGAEAWMVLCRLISLAQYQEARHRFLATRAGEEDRGSVPVGPLSIAALVAHERSRSTLPPPELDLNHCLLAAYDAAGGPPSEALVQGVTVSAVEAGGCDDGSVVSGENAPPAGASPSRGRLGVSLPSLTGGGGVRSDAGFALHVSLGRDASERRENTIVVRRTLSDFEWLHRELGSQQALGQTLSGRILPQPFPKKQHRRYSSPYNAAGRSHRRNARDAAASSAQALGGYIRSWIPTSVLRLAGASTAPTARFHSPPSGPNVPSEHVARAAWLERYANYLSDHPAFATSFPTYALLRSSRTGLDAAKAVLEDARHASSLWPAEKPHRKEEGNMSAAALDPTAFPVSDLTSHPNFTWIRSAAQAAVYLRLYGILDATGMSTASIRLQHASLPNFTFSSWRGGNTQDKDADATDNTNAPHRQEYDNDDPYDEPAFPTPSFSPPSPSPVPSDEPVHVSSELDADADGYDLVAADDAPCPSSPLTGSLPLGSSALCSISSEKVEMDETAARPIRSARQRGDANPLKAGRRKRGACPPHRYGIDPTADGMMGGINVDRDVTELRKIIAKLDQTVNRVLALSKTIGKGRARIHWTHMDLLKTLDGGGHDAAQELGCKDLDFSDGIFSLERNSYEAESGECAMRDSLIWQSSLSSSAVKSADDVLSAIKASQTASRAKVAADVAAINAQNACNNAHSDPAEKRAVQMRAVTCKSEAIHATLINHEAYAAKRRATISLAHDVFYWNAHRKQEFLRATTAHALSQRHTSAAAVRSWESLLRSLRPDDEERRTSRERTAKWEGGTTRPARGRRAPKFTTFSMGRPVPPPSPSEGDEGDADSWSDRSSFGAVPEMAGATGVDVGSLSSGESGGGREGRPPELIECAGPGLADDGTPLTDHDGDLDAAAPEDMTSSMLSIVDGLMEWGGQYDQEDDMDLPNGMAVSIALEESAILQQRGGGENASPARCTELRDESLTDLLEDSIMPEEEDGSHII